MILFAEASNFPMIVMAALAITFLVAVMRGRKAAVCFGMLGLMAGIYFGSIHFARNEVNVQKERIRAVVEHERSFVDRIKERVRANVDFDWPRDDASSRDSFAATSPTLVVKLRSDAFEQDVPVEAVAGALAQLLHDLAHATDSNGQPKSVELRDLEDIALGGELGRAMQLKDIARLSRRKPLGVDSFDETVQITPIASLPQFKKKFGQIVERVESLYMAQSPDSGALIDLHFDDAMTLTVQLPTERLRQVAARVTLPDDLSSRISRDVFDAANEVVDSLADRSADAEEVVSTEEDQAEEEQAEEAEEQAEAAEEQAEAAEEQAEAEEEQAEEEEDEQEEAIETEQEVSEAAVATAEAAEGAPDAAETEAVPGQPDWVDQGDGRGEGNVFRMTGSAGPYSSHDECYAAQRDLMRDLTEKYVTRYLGETAAAEIEVPNSYIESKLLRGEWIGPVETASFGTMYEIHVLLEFDDAARRQFELWWHEARLQRRLWLTGTGAGLVLALLGTAFGYLKLDTATRGYYRGRLMIAAGTLALGATAAASVLAYLGLSVGP